MNIEKLNHLLTLFNRCSFIKFDLNACEVVLGFEGDGGPGETVAPSLVFEDVRVIHLPRIIHETVQFREAMQTQMKEFIPANNYDEEDGGKCFVIQVNGNDLGYYIWSESFRLEGIPSDWPYAQEYLAQHSAPPDANSGRR